MAITRTSLPTPQLVLPSAATSAAAAAYVGAWLVGLAVAPASPAPDAVAGDIARFYLDNGSTALGSSALVHGVAGAALAVLAPAFATRVGAHGGLRRAVIGSGLVAGALSLAQVALAAAAVTFADSDVRRTASLFHALNLVDVLKIALLASFVAVGTAAMTRAKRAPRWLRVLAAPLVPTLVVGSAALVTPAPALSAALAASLVGLLAWVASVGVILRPGRR